MRLGFNVLCGASKYEKQITAFEPFGRFSRSKRPRQGKIRRKSIFFTYSKYIISQLFPKTVEKQAINALTTTPASLANVEVKRRMAVYACPRGVT